MEEASKYWILARLNASGKAQMDQQSLAHDYLKQHNLDDLPQLQRQLFAAYQAGDAIAGLCLRCFLSHCILQECRWLTGKFGKTYHFQEADLLPYVLDDDGSLKEREFVPLTIGILRSFQPNSSALKTWATRLVRQQHELNQFFKEQGLYLVSDWALLNDTRAKSLRRLLTHHYQWTQDEAEEAASILESYQAVYLVDRLEQGQTGKCADPTDAQIQRMLQQLPGTPFSTEQFLSKLQQIAQCLRQNRLRPYRATTQSIDIPAVEQTIDRQSITETQEPEVEQFLELYEAQFLTCLDRALEAVVCDRIAQLNANKTALFLSALQLFHCDRIGMGVIAKRLGLPRQDTVTRLLKLKELRLAVRVNILLCLKTYVLEIAPDFADASQLRNLDQRVQIALGEMLETFMENEEKRDKTPKTFLEKSLFSERLCSYLDRR